MRIAEAFAGAAGRAALMPYLMGGYPDVDRSLAIGRAYVAGGADLIELGIPYSDPLADGPVVHAAGTAALAAGVRSDDVLAIGERLAPDVAVVVMTYVNVVLHHGPEAFARRLADSGAAGLLVPDLPVEESAEIAAACAAAGIELAPFAAPTTTDERMAAIGAQARGFVYTVSTVGTTGEREALSVSELVARVKAHTDVPVAVGFGIGTPDQVAAAAAEGADGVIIGSRLVRAAGDGEDVEALVRGFADALAR